MKKDNKIFKTNELKILILCLLWDKYVKYSRAFWVCHGLIIVTF